MEEYRARLPEQKCEDNVFSHIFQNQNKPGRALEEQFTADQFHNLMVVRDEESGKYRAFYSRREFWSWYEGLSGGKFIHEVIFGSKLQRIKFDLDISLEEQADEKMEAMLGQFVDVVIDEIHVCYADAQVALELDGIILMDSSGSTEEGYTHSYHMILMHYAVANNEEAEYFTARVLDRLDPEIARWVDPNVNKRVQNFRIALSQKVGSSRRKLLNSHMTI